jgi:hypothetical protein
MYNTVVTTLNQQKGLDLGRVTGANQQFHDFPVGPGTPIWFIMKTVLGSTNPKRTHFSSIAKLIVVDGKDTANRYDGQTRSGFSTTMDENGGWWSALVPAASNQPHFGRRN